VLQSVILTNDEKMILTPTYHVLEMYNIHQDAKLLPVSIASTETYTFNNEKLPAVSASASVDDKGVGHVSLVNIDAHKSQEIVITLKTSAYKTVSGRILKSKELSDHNTFESPEKIKPEVFSAAKFDKGVLKVNLPPFSVVVLELK